MGADSGGLQVAIQKSHRTVHALLLNLDKLVAGETLDGEFLLCNSSFQPKEPRLVATGEQVAKCVGFNCYQAWRELIHIKQNTVGGSVGSTLSQLLAALRAEGSSIPAPVPPPPPAPAVGSHPAQTQQQPAPQHPRPPPMPPPQYPQQLGQPPYQQYPPGFGPPAPYPYPGYYPPPYGPPPGFQGTPGYGAPPHMWGGAPPYPTAPYPPHFHHPAYHPVPPPAPPPGNPPGPSPPPATATAAAPATSALSEQADMEVSLGLPDGEQQVTDGGGTHVIPGTQPKKADKHSTKSKPGVGSSLANKLSSPETTGKKARASSSGAAKAQSGKAAGSGSVADATPSGTPGELLTETNLLPHTTVKVYVHREMIATRFAIWANPLSILQGEDSAALFITCKDSRYSIDPFAREIQGAQLVKLAHVKAKQWSDAVCLAEPVTWLGVKYTHDTCLSKLLEHALQLDSSQAASDGSQQEGSAAGSDEEEEEEDGGEEEEEEEEGSEGEEGDEDEEEQHGGDEETRIQEAVARGTVVLKQLLQKAGCPWIESDWELTGFIQKDRAYVRWRWRGTLYKRRVKAVEMAVAAHKAGGKGGKKRKPPAKVSPPAKKAKSSPGEGSGKVGSAPPSTLRTGSKTPKTNASKPAAKTPATRGSSGKQKGWPVLTPPKTNQEDGLDAATEKSMLSNLVKLFTYLKFNNAAKAVTEKWSSARDGSPASREHSKKLCRVYLKLMGAALQEDAQAVKGIVQKDLQLQP